MTNSTLQALTAKETAFLKSLSKSELKKLLDEFKPAERKAIREQLKASPAKPSGSEKAKAREQSYRQSEQSKRQKIRKTAQDIGTLPDELKPDVLEIRERCDASLKVFCEVVFPNAFRLDWSEDHIRLLKRIQHSCDAGALKAIAMPRGSGKTTILIRAIIWSVLTGRRSFGVMIGFDETMAGGLLETIKTELLGNPMIALLYARETFAIRSLGGESRLAGGQRYQGDLTNVKWRPDRIHFGDVPGVATSGACIRVGGITAALRGMQYTDADGNVQRPDIILIDDPQSRESALNADRCKKLHNIIMGDVLGMEGPDGNQVAALCACTIIAKGDLSSRLLDRELSPEWQGELCRMVYAWPKRMDLWDEYTQLRQTDLRADGDGSVATEFYQRNRTAMDDGHHIAWPQRKKTDCISGLQFVFNLRARDEASFMAEYQNDPFLEQLATVFEIDPDEITKRTINLERGKVPADTVAVTGYIDVQKSLLYYMVVAWSGDGRGVVTDFGAFPDQETHYWNKRGVRRTLVDTLEAKGVDDGIATGLRLLADGLMDREFPDEGGTVYRIDRLAIDAAWGYTTDIVRRYCAESKHKGRVHPSFGVGIGANSQPWHKRAANKYAKQGTNCRLEPAKKSVYRSKEMAIDTNYWKTFVLERLLSSRDSRESIVFCKMPTARLRMAGEHFGAEDPVREIGKLGNEAVVFRQNPKHPDNEFLDTLTGCAALASIEAVGFHGRTTNKRRGKPRPNNRLASAGGLAKKVT